MAKQANYIVVDTQVLTDLPNLIALMSSDLAVQGTIALLTHFNRTRQKYYSRKDIQNIFKTHRFTRITSDGNEEEKKLSSSLPTISRWVAALKEATCFDEPYERIVDDRSSIIDPLVTLKPLPLYLADKTQQIAVNRKDRQGGRTPAELNKRIKEWSSSQGNIIPILTDAPMAKARTEKITTILFSASPSEGQAKATDKDGNFLPSVESIFKSRTVGEVRILQTRTTKEKMRLCTPEDKGVLHAILGLTHHAYQTTVLDGAILDKHGVVQINHRNDIIYVMDLNRLCKEVGRHWQTTNDRRTVRESVERLMYNFWEIHAEDGKVTPEFKAKFLSNADTAYYRYIEPVMSVKTLFEKELIEGSFVTTSEDRYIVFKLGTWFQAQISSGETYLVHDELKTDRSEIAQQLYSFARGYCGSGSKGTDKHIFTLYAAWSASFRQMREDNFLTGLLTFAKRQNEKTISPELFDSYYPAEKCDAFVLTDHKVPSRRKIDFTAKPTGTFWYCGYFFKLEINEAQSKILHRKNRTLAKFESYKVPRPILTIWRDENDPLVGNASDANRRRRRIKSEMNQMKTIANQQIRLEQERQANGSEYDDREVLEGDFTDVDDLLGDL